MDKEPPASDVPEEVLDHVRGHMEELSRAWDEKYPENPVHGREDDHE